MGRILFRVGWRARPRAGSGIECLRTRQPAGAARQGSRQALPALLGEVHLQIIFRHWGLAPVARSGGGPFDLASGVSEAVVGRVAETPGP